MVEVTGGDKVAAYLKAIADKYKDATVSVGFLSNATYPADDGKGPQYVATIAAIQNYGAPRAGIPPRPFFTDMIERRAPEWGGDLAHIMKSGASSTQAMEQMGARISGQLQMSIRDTNAPPLSILTLMARKAKMAKFGGETITGSVIGRLAKERDAGPPDVSGVSTKPLVDSGHMLASVNFEVKQGAAL